MHYGILLHFKHGMRMSKPPKILFLVNKASFFISHRLAVAQMAIDEGWEVHVAAPYDKDSVGILEEKGMHFHGFPLDRGSRGIKELKTIAAIGKIYKKIKPDLAFNITMKPVIYGGLVAKYFCKTPSVSMVTGLGYAFMVPGIKGKLYKTLALTGYRLALKRVTGKVIFQNPDDQSLFTKKNVITTSSSPVIIRGTGIDTRLYSPANRDENATPIVLLPARMLWDKGVGEFVAAAKQLKAEGVEARFLLAGDSDKSNPASISKGQILAWQRQGTIEWLGHCPSMQEWYQQANIICLPSYREGLPRALLEAASSACAIVTTDAPGCREVVKEGKNGYLVPVKNSRALATALKKLILDRELCRAMGKEGSRMIEENFSEEKLSRETLNICKSVLKL